jgi:hypothetical protein
MRGMVSKGVTRLVEKGSSLVVHEIVDLEYFAADGAVPRRRLLVDHEPNLGVEARDVSAGVGANRRLDAGEGELRGGRRRSQQRSPRRAKVIKRRTGSLSETVSAEASMSGSEFILMTVVARKSELESPSSNRGAKPKLTALNDLLLGLLLSRPHAFHELLDRRYLNEVNDHEVSLVDRRVRRQEGGA